MLCIPIACRSCASGNSSDESSDHTHSENPPWQYYLGNPLSHPCPHVLSLSLVSPYNLTPMTSIICPLWQPYPIFALTSVIVIHGSHSHPLYLIPCGHVLVVGILCNALIQYNGLSRSHCTCSYTRHQMMSSLYYRQIAYLPFRPLSSCPYSELRWNYSLLSMLSYFSCMQSSYR